MDANKIILIEDNNFFAQGFVEYFRGLGFEVEWFRNYNQFHDFSKFHHLKDYFIFSDFNFPVNCDGYHCPDNRELMRYVFERGLGFPNIVGSSTDFADMVELIKKTLINPLKMAEEGNDNFYITRNIITNQCGVHAEKNIQKIKEKIQDESGLAILFQKAKESQFISNCILHFCAEKLLPSGLLVVRDLLDIGHRNFCVITERGHRIGVGNFFRLYLSDFTPVCARDHERESVDQYVKRNAEYFYRKEDRRGEISFLKIQESIATGEFWKMYTIEECGHEEKFIPEGIFIFLKKLMEKCIARAT